MSFHFNQGDRPLPGYTIQRGVGRGGFGEVYYATSDGGKEIALKYLRDNPQVELRGVTHCLNLKSPYLVGLHDVKQTADGEFFVVMEYVSGPSLRDLMNEEPNGLGPQKAAYFLREIGKGLAYLHDRGIVHRDLKPGNIFYEDGYVKIGDYGLAKIMAASQHSGQTISVGTVHYMAPEIGSGNYDRTIDVYALGVILYEMLLGRVPFSGASMGEVLMKHLTAQPEVDELPAPFPQVIRKALAKSPQDRYQSVNEMMSEVFAVDNISQSVASMDSLNLTRMAAAVAQKVKVGGGDRLGTGSSNVPTLDARAQTPPPPVVDYGRSKSSSAKRERYPLWEDFRRRPFGIGPAASFPQRYRTTTGLLGVFLGPWGIHRFYTGHNSIGVYQILATFLTGIGGLWGIIEGIQILMNGDYRDSLGRPLLERRARSEPGSRSKLGRAFWAIPGVLFLLASIGLTLGATFANPPDMERVGWSFEARDYYFNSYHLMYFFACIAFAMGVFNIWKAAHRGGLSWYRATIRPGLMCFCMALMGVAYCFQRILLAGDTQIVGLITIGVAGLGFVFLWFLRGPRTVQLKNDGYWNRAWAIVFIMVAMLASFGSLRAYQAWNKEGRRFYNTSLPVFSEVEVVRNNYAYDIELGKHVLKSKARNYQVPNVKYNHLPMAAGLLALLAIGSFGEYGHRLRLIKLSKKNDRQQKRVGRNDEFPI